MSRPMLEQNKALARRLFEEMLSQGKVDVANNIFTKNFVFHTIRWIRKPAGANNSLECSVKVCHIYELPITASSIPNQWLWIVWSLSTTSHWSVWFCAHFIFHRHQIESGNRVVIRSVCDLAPVHWTMSLSKQPVAHIVLDSDSQEPNVAVSDCAKPRYIQRWSGVPAVG